MFFENIMNKLCLYKLSGLGGNHHFFISGDDKDLYAALRLADLNILTPGAIAVELIIGNNAEIAKTANDAFADVGCILAHTCGEYDGVNAVHCGNICADVLLDLVCNGRKSKLCTLVPLLCGSLNITHVA